jgi:hypothetical protein
VKLRVELLGLYCCLPEQRQGFGTLWVGLNDGDLHRLGLRGLTFELSGRQRQDARPRPVKMDGGPQARAWWPAVGAPLERGVMRH